MNDLLRGIAPLSAAAWQAIDEEAVRTLKPMLAARRIADFEGPLGYDAAAVNLGRVSSLPGTRNGGVQAALRAVQPLVELRVTFELSREEMRSFDRGAEDVDLQPVTDAARAMALAEDRAVFHGFGEAYIQGMCEAAQASAITIPSDYALYPRIVAEALAKLRKAGIAGPYALALGPRCYTGLTQTTTHGYPVMQHVQRLLDGPAIWAPGVDGAVAVSLRGGDFKLVVGRDFSIGYDSHCERTVRLYLEESFTFRVLTPEAAVPLVYPSAQQEAGGPKGG